MIATTTKKTINDSSLHDGILRRCQLLCVHYMEKEPVNVENTK